MAAPSAPRTLLPLLAGVFLAVAPTRSDAGGTRTHRLDDFSSFDKGEVEGAAIEGSGRVTLGLQATRTGLTGTTAFTCLGTTKEVFVGTSDVATVQRLTFVGRQRDAKVEEFAKLPGIVVSALTKLPNGDLVAATVPGGTLHRIGPRGKVSEFAKLDVQQVWALAVHQGRLLVATGPKGELFSVALDGKDAKVVLDVDEKDLLSLALLGDAVIVGTSPRAKLYQVTKELGGLLVHDFAGDEVRAIARTRSALVVAVNAFEDRKLSSLDALTKTLNRTSLLGQPPAGDVGQQETPKAEVAIYAVSLGRTPDLARASEAAWETWLKKDDQYVTGMLGSDADETVLVASSDDGKVYRLRGRRDVAAIADLEERRATALCRSGSEIVVTAGDGAAAYRLHANAKAKARYVTQVLDAKQPSAYGVVRLRGTGALKLRARVGPSEEPDARWSEWREIPLSEDRLGHRGSLKSLSKRRFMQLEVVLGSANTELRELAAFYAPENLPPLLQSIAVSKPSFDDDDEEPDRELTIKWNADARDEDDLVYEVRVRREGETDDDWIKLHPLDELVTKQELKWNVTSVPNGVYEVGVRASDAPSNGSAHAATDELVSTPFIVDHDRPSIKEVKIGGTTASGRAIDGGSYVHDVAYSIDEGPFQAASPSDGLFDEDDEVFTLSLPSDLTQGRHRLVVRVRDSFGNLTANAFTFDR